MNPLLDLRKRGQSIWLDYIRRDLIRNGELKQLIENDGLRGVTSNPSIFEKAIDDSTQYDEALHVLFARNPTIEPRAVYDTLSIEDVRDAADTLLPAYQESGGLDGFVRGLELATILCGAVRLEREWQPQSVHMVLHTMAAMRFESRPPS
jgi:transaldolase